MRVKVGFFSFERSPAEEIVNELIARNDVSGLHILKEDYITGKNRIIDVTKINIHENYDSLLKNVDAIVAILSKFEDYKILSEALNSNKPVLVEGPLALSKEKLEEFIKKEEIICVPSVLDYDPYLKELLNAKKAIGDILSISISARVKVYGHEIFPEVALCALYRYLDIACSVTETIVKNIVSVERAKDNSLMLLLESESGALISIDVILTRVLSDMKVVIVGTEGSVTLDNLKQNFTIYTQEGRYQEFFGPKVYHSFLDYFFGVFLKGIKTKMNISYIKNLHETIISIRELLKGI